MKQVLFIYLFFTQESFEEREEEEREEREEGRLLRMRNQHLSREHVKQGVHLQ